MKNNIIILSALISFLLLTACNNKKVNETTSDENTNTKTEMLISITNLQAQNIGIQLGKTELQIIGKTIVVNGMLDVPPQQLITIAAPLGGFVKKTDLLQGMHVIKGQTLAIIENLEFVQLQQDYLEAKAQAELNKQDYDRQADLQNQNANALKTLQQAKGAFDIANARYKGLTEKLKIIGVNIPQLNNGNIQPTVTIASPITGFVTKVNANIGKYVTATDVLFEIADTEHLHAELTVFEKDVPLLAINQEVQLQLANEDKIRQATIQLIGKEVSIDRTVRVHCHLNKEDHHLIPGTFLQASIATNTSKQMALPNAAIVNYEANTYIFVTTDKANTYTMLPVTVGLSNNMYTQVTIPAQYAGRIVTKGAYDLLAALKNSEE
ncbi:MAG: efflux RND transporter periplasmic adaptor subunit [Bacteroidia bacterium]|nr:efflux RND transporter periplasmic adaptor subunit [Bacteroidia bacterium]